MRKTEPRVFPALIRHWRARRGLSQLDLALAAEVSARHVSFLETGRAQPSRDMVLRLAAALDVPLRDQNALLQAAGLEEAFNDDPRSDLCAPVIALAIRRMLEQQEPFPLTVLDRRYDVVQMNAAAQRIFPRFVADPSAVGDGPINVYHMLFDPRLARSFIHDWENVARGMLSRLHREFLERPADVELGALLRSLTEYEGVPRDWHSPDFTRASEPCLSFRLTRGELELGFLTTITAFNAPQNVTLDELRIESYFPLDEATRRACEALAATGQKSSPPDE
ncbi:MAG: helix-turn-helix transcriptional regulator [Polyangiaceae bacterium]